MLTKMFPGCRNHIINMRRSSPFWTSGWKENDTKSPSLISNVLTASTHPAPSIALFCLQPRPNLIVTSNTSGWAADWTEMRRGFARCVDRYDVVKSELNSCKHTNKKYNKIETLLQVITKWSNNAHLVKIWWNHKCIRKKRCYPCMLKSKIHNW